MMRATAAICTLTRTGRRNTGLRSIPVTSTRMMTRFLSAPPFAEGPIILGVGKGKTSTGLVGLAVERNWYNVLTTKFQGLLNKMEASDMPETAQYRIDVTKWCNYVLQQAHANPTDPEAVEDAVNMGQVEELIEMADDEMIALETYLKSRMWEVVAQMNPVLDFEPDPTKDPTEDPVVNEHLREGMKAK